MNKFPIQSIDLCAQEVRVSTKGLCQLAEIATARSLRDMENALRAIQDAAASNLSRDHYHTQSQAKALEYAAADFRLASHFLHAFRSLDKGERTELNLYPEKS